MINMCDGCQRGMPLDKNGIHHGEPGVYDHIGCTKHLYDGSPPRGINLGLKEWQRMKAASEVKEHPLKGVKFGYCNVTACQKPGAYYFNKSTKKYYCKECADEINWPGGRADCMALYGVPLLCELDAEDKDTVINSPTNMEKLRAKIEEMGAKISGVSLNENTGAMTPALAEEIAGELLASLEAIERGEFTQLRFNDSKARKSV